MKTKNFEIRSLNESVREVKEAFHAAMKRKKFKPRTGVYFTSLEAVRNFLTPKRLELLHLIREKHPRSLYELAKFANRSFPSILRDVETLKKHGLITLVKSKKQLRTTYLPQVDYDAISLTIGV